MTLEHTCLKVDWTVNTLFDRWQWATLGLTRGFLTPLSGKWDFFTSSKYSFPKSCPMTKGKPSPDLGVSLHLPALQVWSLYTIQCKVILVIHLLLKSSPFSAASPSSGRKAKRRRWREESWDVSRRRWLENVTRWPLTYQTKYQPIQDTLSVRIQTGSVGPGWLNFSGALLTLSDILLRLLTYCQGKEGAINVDGN